MALVLVTRDDAVATVTLNRPEAMNALSRSLRAELATAMRGLAAYDDVRAIVLTGAGRALSPQGSTSRSSAPTPATSARPMRRVPTKIR